MQTPPSDKDRDHANGVGTNMTLFNKIRASIQTKIVITIVAIALFIIVFGLVVGAMFLMDSISRAMEEYMLVSVDVADQFVVKEIELLKHMAAEAADDIELLNRAGEGEGVANIVGVADEVSVLERVCTKYPTFIGMAVFNETTLLDSWAKYPVPPDLISEPFMQTALAGGQVISTTMYSPDGSLVMYVSTPIGGGLVLAAVLPGLHLSNVVSEFTLWETCHLFVDDAEGTVISNIRNDWVLQRYNFIILSKTMPIYEGLGRMASRGVTMERGTIRFNLVGPRMCAFRPVTSPNEGWFLGIVAPLTESVMYDIPSGIILIGLITLILSVVAAIIAASILKRPYEEVDRLRRVAEIASTSKSVFLANMSHEIRTPMNSIMGFSELAMDDEASPRTRDYLDKIRTNADWLLQIINDILDITKIESGKMELEHIPFDLHDLFVSCRTLIMPKAIEKGITLQFYVEPSIGKMPLGDPTRLRQVFVNLLSNAVKFTNVGVVKLQAVIKGMSEYTVSMHFEVKDSGIGMSKEQIDKIFDPFMQADSGTTRKYGGTGLGLSICKNFIELMGGMLSVESTVGVGSRFSFDLTFETVDIPEEKKHEKKIMFDEIEKPNFEGEVLLCEDNVMNQQVICEHLARVGLSTVVAENGKIGVDMVRGRMLSGAKQFDLILMDMHMPVMDGLEAAEKIIEYNANVPIVALTANVMASDREIYREGGMIDCVGKPFTSRELWLCLLKYLKPVSRDAVDGKGQAEIEAKFQRELREFFVRNNQERFNEIAGALKNEDIDLAHRLAHGLKSNAGQIGKTRLQQAAADVEAHLKDGRNLVTEKQLRTLNAELYAVLTELAPLLDEGGNKSETAAIEPEKVQALIERLEPLLKSGNPECLNFINDLRAVPGSGTLIQQIKDFDFESAYSTLAELKKGST
jgi:signal transduction histidine kinase/DNA-binding response OmpR family regulator